MTNGPVAILLGERGSLSPVEIAAASSGTLPYLFVLDARSIGRGAARLRDVAESLAPTIHADFSAPGSCANAIREAGAHTAATFVDELCPLVAEIVHRLDPSADGPANWGRKETQRLALVAAGISRVRSAVLEDPADVRALLDDWRTAVVVKPINGVASAYTWLLRLPSDVDRFIEAVGSDVPGRLLFAEEYIAGVPREAPQLGDYVSVEVVRHEPGEAPLLAFVTDRAPVAPPCRETGLMWPTSLPAQLVTRLVTTANDALEALRTRRGTYHVELKPGHEHDEIVEVNGRLGGFVGRAAAYGADVDMARLSLAVAAGVIDDTPLTINWRRCVAVVLFPAPRAARRISKAPTRRSLSRLDGVLAVDRVRGEGESCAWERGTDDAVAALWISADDHQELWARFSAAAEFLTRSYGFLDEHGRPTDDPIWLATVTGAHA
jgi:hypothetical protein